jgi:hypothetical protein
MTTLETKPIAFFFSPLSPPLGPGPAELGGAGTAALSMRLLSRRSAAIVRSDRSKVFVAAGLHKWQMSQKLAVYLSS